MTKKYSVFEYLYRDAGNNKVYGSVILRGSISTEKKTKLVDGLNNEQWFIAEQVGLPPLFEELWKYSDGQTEEDLPFHEFSDIRNANDRDLTSATIWGELDELLSRFENAANCWDIQQSGCKSY